MFRYRLPIILCLVITSTACYVLSPPTPMPTSTEPAPTETVPHTPTESAVSAASPTPPPPDQATSTPDSTTRIQFAPGTTFAELSSDLTQPTSYDYVLYAQEGQTIKLQNGQDSDEIPDLQITIQGADGVVLATGNLSDAGEVVLPSTQDYYITIQADAPYRLKLTIPASEVCSLSEETLRNATYTLDDFEFQLVDGEADLPQVVPGDPEENRRYARYMSLAGCGDLNGDGDTDAIVILDTHTINTTGHFRKLAVVLNRDGQPDNVTMTDLGDRTIIQENGNTVQPGIVELNVITHGPQDGLCCPSQEERWQFEFTGDALIRR